MPGQEQNIGQNESQSFYLDGFKFELEENPNQHAIFLEVRCSEKQLEQLLTKLLIKLTEQEIKDWEKQDFKGAQQVVREAGEFIKENSNRIIKQGEILAFRELRVSARKQAGKYMVNLTDNSSSRVDSKGNFSGFLLRALSV